jgi:hypothetical protein
MTLVEALGLGVGLLAIVTPEWWDEMPRPLKYIITALGLACLAWSGILMIEDVTGMKIQPGR